MNQRVGRSLHGSSSSSSHHRGRLQPNEVHRYHDVNRECMEMNVPTTTTGSTLRATTSVLGAPTLPHYSGPIAWRSPSRYAIVSKVGRGKYSDVFVAHDSQENRMVVVKVLKPVKKEKIFREYAILQAVKGGPNIVSLLDVVRDPVIRRPAFVFEHVEAEDFRVLFPSLTDMEVRHYMFLVLQALEHAHSLGIMHRDVKPNNVCIDHSRRTLRLIDWGLAETFYPETPYNARVASRFFKGPELLVELPFYDYRLDMWSFGCMFGGIIFMLDPLFRGSDNTHQLLRIIQVLGSELFMAYIDKYRVRLSGEILQAASHYPTRPWSSFITPQNKHLCPPEALDLLSQLLRFDHTERVQAREAMEHPYFDPVRSAAVAAAAAALSSSSNIKSGAGPAASSSTNNEEPSDEVE